MVPSRIKMDFPKLVAIVMEVKKLEARDLIFLTFTFFTSVRACLYKRIQILVHGL